MNPERVRSERVSQLAVSLDGAVLGESSPFAPCGVRSVNPRGQRGTSERARVGAHGDEDERALRENSVVNLSHGDA